ncbi:hypothetical protein G4X40_01670 [Rhodococcus sp. D2-41]|uniref:hypothetical protein n=1 Tax=Speluncibacter jeojiensis TaxID=2710754 RepID=UPI00241049C4|nr:hypothetical protein [Rhodococcus sp. D2-41]MDG3008852.1 hypothetical protein [Rhodococcus sp. D2-41]
MTIRPLRHRAARAAVIAVAAVTGLGACASSNSSSSSTGGGNPQAAAQQQVQDLTGRFMTVFSGVQTDPAKYQGQIETVATGGAAQQMHQTAQNILTRHFSATGSYAADHVTVLSTQLPGDKGGEKKATAQVRLCYNPTGITVTQQDGSKVPTAPGILDHAQVTFTVVNAQYPDAQGWRVLRAQGGPKTPCEAS